MGIYFVIQLSFKIFLKLTLFLRIGYQATISAPHMHAYAMEILQDHLTPNSRVLDVGAGSGFLSVCFSRFLTSQSERSTGIVGN